MAQGGDTTTQIESWTTASGVRGNMRLFPRAKKIQNRPKMGVRTHFFATRRLDLEQACMARSACRRVAAL